MKHLALVAFLALLYLPALGSPASGTHPDESWYLGISAEMDAKNDWLTPTLDDVPTWFKPPLLYWAEMASYRLLGRNLFAARLPAAFSSIALSLLTLALGRRMAGERGGLLAALLTATSFGFVKFGRMAMMDAPMALALASAAYGTWRAAEEGRERELLLAGVGAAAAFLLKGPVGPVLVLLIAGGYLAVRAPRLLASRHSLGAFLLGAALGLPWYVASFAVHGTAFYDFFVVSQNYDRFRHAWTLGGETSLLLGFLVFLLPWTVLFVAALPALRRLRDPAVLLPAIWIGAVLLTFSIPSLKWPHYGLTAIPAAALLAARAPPRWARLATAALLGLGAAAWLLAFRWPLPAAVAAAMALGAAALAAAALLAASDRLPAAAAAFGTAAALLVAFAVPAVGTPAIPPEAMAALGGRSLYVYDFTPGIFTLGAGRPVRRAQTEDQVGRALASGAAVIFADPDVAHLPPAYRGRVVELARWTRTLGNLPAEAVWRSWLRRDPTILRQGMVAVALSDSALAKPGARP